MKALHQFFKELDLNYPYIVIKYQNVVLDNYFLSSRLLNKIPSIWVELSGK